jgi:tetratricopeptide (TPR) repeat protein
MGELEKARVEFDVATEQPIESIPRDYSWRFVLEFLSRVAIPLGEAELARRLYETMLPYADRNASNAGAISFGSAALILAQLAAFLGDQRAAEQHFERALAFNIRTRQRVWVARTRYHYAEMLLARAAKGDADRARELVRVARADALELGMSELSRKLDALAETSV